MIKRKLLCIMLLFFTLCGCQSKEDSGHIYLYGELHDRPLIKEEEFKIWKEYYQEGMRHLFIEKPYYTAMYLNEWIKAEDDDILLNWLVGDWGSSFSASDASIDFYLSIKKECPETIFHGTDVGHQYKTTGQRYLNMLESQNKQDSMEYKETLRCIQQGKEYYASLDMNVREQMMYENFIREYQNILGEDIMGIYGLAHVIDCGNLDGSVDYMGKALQNHYQEDKVHHHDLTQYGYVSKPINQLEIIINDKIYQMDDYGIKEVYNSNQKMRFYHIKDAYDDLKNLEKIEDCYPTQDFLMQTTLHEIYMIEYILENNQKNYTFFMTDGSIWEGLDVAVAINMKGIEYEIR